MLESFYLRSFILKYALIYFSGEVLETGNLASCHFAAPVCSVHLLRILDVYSHNSDNTKKKSLSDLISTLVDRAGFVLS